MTLWIILAIMTLIAIAFVVLPLWRSKQEQIDRQSFDLTIYKDQLDEIERDLARGVIGDQEAEAARVEISRRMLSVDAEQRLATLPLSTGFLRVTGISAALLMAVGSVLFYLNQGEPTAPAQLFAAAEQRKQVDENNAEMAGLVEGLVEKLRTDPENLDNWILLARSYAMMRDYARAAGAWGEAAALSPDDPELLSAYAEAQIFSNDGQVTPSARRALIAVVEVAPMDPRAQYYLGLSDVQAGSLELGVNRWAAILRASPPDAPWRSMVLNAVEEVAPDAGMDMSTLADLIRVPTVEEMVAAMEANPKDWQGWMRLMQRFAQEGRTDEARDALDQAKDVFKGAPFVLQQFNSFAANLGLVDLGDTLSPPQPTAQLGNPTAADIQAAQDMAPEDRQQMILGMVASLAEKLEDDPANLEGWLRLIRSYTVLQKPDEAAQAYADAKAAFAGNDSALAQISQTAQMLGLQ